MKCRLGDIRLTTIHVLLLNVFKRNVRTNSKKTMKVEQGDKKLHKPASGVPFLTVFIIATVAFGVYFNTLFNGFVYDDNGQILGNPWIKDVKHLPEIFYKSVWSFQVAPSISSYYRPLMHVIYMFNYYLFGLKPWGFHLVNVLFHAANSVLVFLVAARLLNNSSSSVLTSFSSASSLNAPSSNIVSTSTLISTFLGPPFVTALLFATHPIHTESVAWVAAIPELSYTLFFLLSFYLFLRSGSGIKNYAYFFSVMSFSFALLSKETAAALPIILVMHDLAFRNAGQRLSAYARRYLPYLAILGIYLIMRSYALGGLEPMKAYRGLDTYQFVINVFPLFARYLEKLLVPVDLNAFFVYHPITSLSGIKGMIGLVITASYVLLGIIAYRKKKTAFFCLVLIAVPLLPAFYVPAVSQAPFSERYLYLPSVGFVLLLTMSLSWLRGKIAQSGLAIILFVVSLAGWYSFQTITRNPVWKDDLTLFTDTVKKSPDGETPNGMLGIALMGAGRFEEAIEQFRKTLKLNPNSANAYYNLGLTLMKKGLPAEAVPEFQKALALTPDDLDARRYLAEAYTKTGMTEKAEEQYRILEKSGQNPPATYVELGIRLAKEGRLSEAVEQYKKALAIDPDYVDAHYNLGAVYANSENIDKAIEHLRKAAALQPGNAFYRNMLGIAYGQKGMYAEAVGQFREAVRLAPEEPAYRKNLKRAEGLKGPAGKN